MEDSKTCGKSRNNNPLFEHIETHLNCFRKVV